MTCPKHETTEEYAHCNEVTLFKRIAKDAKGLLEARGRLMALMGTGQAWDDQQIVVQNCIRSLEASVHDADFAGLFRDSSDSPK